MNYPVVSIEQDLSGRWYARVSVSDAETVFFKFTEYPTSDEIQQAASNYVESLEVINATTN
jgi:hypothetical protein